MKQKKARKNVVSKDNAMDWMLTPSKNESTNKVWVNVKSPKPGATIILYTTPKFFGKIEARPRPSIDTAIRVPIQYSITS